jgi:catechol 2,3-dioxygenase-like lactoylglutathione lyase family enzyme
VLGRRFVPICLVALGARHVAAQIAVVGPSFAALSVPDLAASVRWYREVFGLSVVFEAVTPDSATKVALLAGAGLRIELVWHQNAKPLSSYAGGPTQPDLVFGAPKIGFFVPDMDSAVAVLRTHGATIEGTWLVRPPNTAASDTLWTRNILVRDNSGTYVQLFERRP